MRSVSIQDSALAMNPFEDYLNFGNSFYYMQNNPAKEKIQEMAKINFDASLDIIAERAGFASRKTIQYYFGTRKNLFKSIGVELKSPKERLIEACKKLPYAASSRQITKKAGYKSHKIIQVYFKSLEELKRVSGKYLCNKDKISFNGVEFSLQDVSRGITIPEKITGLVAEEAGWHAGDGSLYKPQTGVEYNYCLGGDPNEEKEFYDYIKESIKKIYNLDVKIRKLSRGNLLGVVLSSKAIFTYKKYLGFPIGNKSKIVETPKIILNSKGKKIKSAFIRGLADTDFSLVFAKKHKQKHYYPNIVGSLNSKKLISQVAGMLRDLGFRVTEKTQPRKDKNTQYIVKIQGVEQLEKWIKEISFNNPKHMTKYLVWKEFGFCPPKTKIRERKLMLNKKLNPILFYGGENNA